MPTQHDALELARTIQAGGYASDPRLFPLWEAHGFHLTPVHFYSAIPDVSALPEATFREPRGLAGLDMNEAKQLQLLRDQFPRYKAEYDAFPRDPTPRPYDYYLNQFMFRSGDAEILHCMVRHFAPRRMIEIGSGFSTLISAAAIRQNQTLGRPCELTAIEPYPNPTLRQGVPGLTRLISTPVQQVPLEVFQELAENDILFIDSSHVVKIGSDVVYEFLEILPRLAKGVLVHVHDIFLPHEYPETWVRQEARFWTEQYLLHAFMLFNSKFEVLLAANYLATRHGQLFRQTFANFDGGWPGSFWIRSIR
jgi:Methyltransferase domain